MAIGWRVMIEPRAIGSATSIIAELWGLRDGHIICSQLHLPAVEIELDAKVVVCLVCSNIESLGEFTLLVDDCRVLLRRLPMN